VSRPAVAIVTNERDFAADVVVRRLHEFGVEVHRINYEAARARVRSASPQRFTAAPGGSSQPSGPASDTRPPSGPPG